MNGLTAGLVLVTGACVRVVLSPVAGRLADPLERRHVTAAGAAASVLGLLGLRFLGTETP
ncbi:MAG: hypothetical protein LLG45_00085 [Actinomycetia bacterium]|nr:hypothetical protein [Actinomycetes bacterium]